MAVHVETRTHSRFAMIARALGSGWVPSTGIGKATTTKQRRN
jgi:hypothetical protein